MKRNKKVTFIAATGILSSISILLYYFVKFPLPIFPSFLDIQISELPALIGGFAYGPWCGILIIIIRCLVKLPASTTGMVGELGDLLISLALIIPSTLIYKKKKTFKMALLSYIIGIIISTSVAMLVNAFILVPFYSNAFGFDAIIGMCKMIPGINDDNFMRLYLLVGILPFNLLRYVIVGILTFLLYKKTHKLLDKIK